MSYVKLSHETHSETDICMHVIFGEFLQKHSLQGNEESRSEQRERLDYNAVATESSSLPQGALEPE